MTLNEVADLIDSPNSEFLCWGNYLNRRGIRGYYQQTKCGNHWCRISVSKADYHADRITISELDEIDTNVLEQVTKIPRLSISYALRWGGEREEVSVNRYLNGAGVEGIWSEFYYEDNWYMVSISHIDVPAYARPKELEKDDGRIPSAAGTTPGRAEGSLRRLIERLCIGSSPLANGEPSGGPQAVIQRTHVVTAK